MKFTAFIVSIVALSGSGHLAAAEWVMDTENSRLEFVASYTGSDMPGTFRQFDVALRFDPADPAAGRLSVTVDVTSADMGDADMNEAVTGEIWFDVARFATARFDSTEIARRESGGFEAAGTLELKGVSRPVSVPFTWQQDSARGSMRGELVLQRLDFGIGSGSWTATDEVAGEVRVRFDVAFTEDR